MKNRTRKILATTIVIVALTALVALALAGETDNTTAYGYQVDTAVEELKNPAEMVGDDETNEPETTVPDTTVPETTVPETEAPETTVPETTAPTLHLRPLKNEEVERVIFVTLSNETVTAAVAGGKEVRALHLTAIAVSDDGCINFEHGEYAFSVRCPQNIDLSQPVIVYFILG